MTQPKKKILNPYNRSKFPRYLHHKILNIYKISKILNINTNVSFNTGDEDISFEKKIKFKTIDLFNKMDEFGFITNIDWFLKLNRLKLCKLIKELKDVWNYRLQIPINLKVKICPRPNPFNGFSHHIFIGKPLHVLQNKILNILKNFVTMGINDEHKKLGTYYVMGALTLVSHEASTSCPWLFSAFTY